MYNYKNKNLERKIVDQKLDRVIRKRFEQWGYPYIVNRNIIPKDNTTLFICSGMQPIRHRFQHPDGERYGSCQSCIRTNDIDAVGDGYHLTYFEMIGNFGFGANDYDASIELWCAILQDLNIRPTTIHVHPTRDHDRKTWADKGYKVIMDQNCTWSDGDINGTCCEIYVKDIEIGNLVNPMNHSTDVGFGKERLLQILEDTSRVDNTTLFHHKHPIVADHSRTIATLWDHGIAPGNRGRNYICRRLIRRMLPYLDGKERWPFTVWIENEKEKRTHCVRRGRSAFNRHRNKPVNWWWETYGILPEEIAEINGKKSINS